MHSVPCPVLLVPLLLASALTLAQERPPGRVSRSRVLPVPLAASGAPPELHVAGGTATVVTVNAALAAEGPRIQDEHGRFRLVPLEGPAFIVLPSADVPEGERVLLTVPLQSGGALELTLVSRGDEVDTEVRLVPRDEEGVRGVVRLLNASTEGAVELPLPRKRLLLGGPLRLRLKSILRIDRQVFISLSVWGLPQSGRLEQALSLRASTRRGELVALPVVDVAQAPSTRAVQQYTLAILVPEGADQLLLGINPNRASDEALSFSLHRAKPTP